MKRLKNCMKIVIFIGICMILIYGFNRLFIHKSPECVMMDEFLSLDKNTVDLLCVGSSHAYTSCNTEVYWNDFGIPAFCISGPSQSVVNSYYYMKEAFKTQNPKVVLLEASCLSSVLDSNEYRVVNNIAWMPYSKDRAEALKDSVEDLALRSNLEWNLFYYHSRWTQLTNQDFEYIFKNYRPGTKGFNPWWNYADYTDKLELWGTEYMIEPSEESVSYVDSIIALCEEHNAKLVIYVSPHFIGKTEYGRINWYREYFAQRNIEMIDGILLADEIGIEPDTDICNNHVAYTGAIMFSEYIGNYLTDKGYVADRKDEEGYESWEKWSHYYEDTAGMYSLVNVKDLVSYLEKLDSLNNSITIIAFDGGAEDGQMDEKILDVMDSIGLHLDLNGEGAPYIAVLGNGKVVEQLQTRVTNYRNKVLNHEIEINLDEDKRVNILLDYDRITELNQVMAENAFQIFVYNCISEEVVENRVFYLESEVGQ